MLHALRIPIAAFAGATFTAAMFWLLWSLIESSFEAGERVEAGRIEFSRMRRDTEVATKRDEKVERERPPPTPEAPRLAFSTGGIDNSVARLAPVVDARGAMSRMSMTAGSDRDVIPLVRINPDYPQRALQRGLEGWVEVQFTITAIETVKDAKVVNAEPKDTFDDAALKAIARWRYNPKVESGVAVERVGVQTIIRFQLEQ
jgi:periplasmic protein TonB